MKVLVINSGSSSIKYKFFDMNDESVIADGLVERIGDESVKGGIANHKEGLTNIAESLTSRGIIKDESEVDIVVHRVVHGGDRFTIPTILTDDAISAIKDNIPLAPLHNPPNLTGIEVASQIFKSAKQIGVFDTSFHSSMEEDAYRYALPEELYTKFKIRRYGFHGTSHSYVAKRCAELLEKELDNSNIITLHLGNGCSVAAIKNGKSIDTSMGLTPLEGLIMGTRCGDIDPALPKFISDQCDMDMASVDNLLNKKSGLKGICESNDLRDIIERVEKGDPKADLAIKMYVRRIKKYIGGYLATIGKTDAIVFTAGVGENSAVVRELVLTGLSHLGIEIDLEKNKMVGQSGGQISTISSSVKVYVIPTNEELEMARESVKLV